MYGMSNAPLVRTQHHYLGIIQGSICHKGTLYTKPFVYFTPAGIDTPSGWNSPPGKSRDNYYIECSGERADRLFAAFGAFRSCRQIPIKDPHPFISLLNEMQQLFSSGDPLAAVKLSLCLEEFAAQLESVLLLNNTSSGWTKELKKIMEAISLEPGKKWNFSDEAEKAGISLRHWNRLFTSFAKMSPQKFVSQCRLRNAKKLLTSTKLPIKQIACQNGFEGTSEFIRFFKKNIGTTPAEYRKNSLL